MLILGYFSNALSVSAGEKENTIRIH